MSRVSQVDELVLVVRAAQTIHNYKGRAIFLPRTMNKLGISIGDPVRILSVAGASEGESKCKYAVGVAFPSTLLTENSVELDAVIRKNCNVKIGDFVLVQKCNSDSFIIDAGRLYFTRVDSDDPQNSNLQSHDTIDIFLQYNLIGQYLAVGNEVLISMYGRIYKFILERAAALESQNLCACDSIYRVQRETQIIINKLPRTKQLGQFSFSHIGGLATQIEQIRTLIETPLKNPDLFIKYGVKPPRGILLFGPPGTGKTLLAKILCHEMQVPFYAISATEILSSYYGESESRLARMFEQATLNSPSLIFIDEIDTIAQSRDKSDSEESRRLVGTLLTLMDGIDTKCDMRVLVIASTNRPNDLDPALRRPGRFDKEIELPIPNEHGRLEILNLNLKNMTHALTTDQIKEISAKLHGYVGADIVSLCKEAGLVALKRAYYEMDKKLSGLRISPEEDSVDQQLMEQVRVVLSDMNEALYKIRPSAMREIMVDIPKVQWTDIGGYEIVKQKLREAAEWPLKYPEAFERMGIDPPKGILLYGPPGCSKTLLAKALATQAGLNFIPVKGPELFSKYVGDSEKAVRDVFRKARAAAPSIVFFDEVDAIGGERGSSSDSSSVHDRVLAQMLNELDGIERLNKVLFLAATNRPDIIDKALMRPGRIDRIIYVGPPDLEARKQIFAIQLKKISHHENVNVEQLARRSDGLTGAEIVSVCREACLCAMQDDMQTTSISQHYFEDALTLALKNTMTPQSVSIYKNFK